MNLIILATILIATQAPTANRDARLVAIDEYRQGLALRADSAAARVHFRKAAIEFSKSEDADRPAELCRLQANAWFLAGESGLAIAMYRKGLESEPYNRDLLEGLTFARDRVNYPRIGELAELARKRHHSSSLAQIHPDRLYAIAIAVYAIGWYFLLRSWWNRSRRTLANALVLIAMGIAFGGWVHREDEAWRAQWKQPVVVLNQPSNLLTGNNDEYPKRHESPLPQGLEVTAVHERGGWYQIELANGQRGWIPQNVAIGREQK